MSLSKLYRKIKRLIDWDDGATAVEYAVMLALIIGTLIWTIDFLGASASEKFSQTSNALYSPDD